MHYILYYDLYIIPKKSTRKFDIFGFFVIAYIKLA